MDDRSREWGLGWLDYMRAQLRGDASAEPPSVVPEGQLVLPAPSGE